MKTVLLTLLVGLVLMSHTLAQSGIHKWIDAEGRVHYSDKPKPEADKFAGTSSVEAKDQALLDQFQQGLSTGNREAVVALFRYFEEVVDSRIATADRRIAGYFLRLVEEEFGRPETFFPSQTLSRRYVSTLFESSSDEQWNASACLFKSYVLKTVFGYADSKRPAEVIVTICTGPRIERPMLRQIDLRFVSPDAVTGKKVQFILERATLEARRAVASGR
jgi:hypothetical protein